MLKGLVTNDKKNSMHVYILLENFGWSLINFLDFIGSHNQLHLQFDKRDQLKIFQSCNIIDVCNILLNIKKKRKLTNKSLVFFYYEWVDVFSSAFQFSNRV